MGVKMYLLQILDILLGMCYILSISLDLFQS